MNKYYLYIGSNNKTHKLEKKEAIKIISNHFDGFTVYEVIGFWQGSEEKTLKVEIVSDNTSDTKIIRVCKELARELNQDAIMLERVQSNVAFIQAK